MVGWGGEITSQQLEIFFFSLSAVVSLFLLSCQFARRRLDFFFFELEVEAGAVRVRKIVGVRQLIFFPPIFEVSEQNTWFVQRVLIFLGGNQTARTLPGSGSPLSRLASLYMSERLLTALRLHVSLPQISLWSLHLKKKSAKVCQILVHYIRATLKPLETTGC